MELSPAARVGMVATLALILLGLIVVQVGKVGREAGAEYEVLFHDVAGLQTRAAVYLAGVKVGYVSGMELTPENRVKVAILITRKGVELYPPDGYTYTISGNMMGDRWVDIQPGNIAEGVEPLAPGELVRGNDPVTLDELARKGHEVIEEFGKSVRDLNKLVADPKFQDDIKVTVTNFREISDNLKGVDTDVRSLVSTLNLRLLRLSDSLDRVMAHVEDTVAEFRRDAGVVGANLRSFSAGLNQAVADNRGNLDTVILNLRQTSVSLKKALRSLEEIAADPGLKEDVLAAAENLRRTSEAVQGIAEDIRSFTSDPEVQSDLRETVTNVREATAGAKRIIKRVEGFTGGERGKIVEVDLSHEYNPDDGQPATNINAMLFPQGGPFTARLGVDALGRTNLVNLQGGKTFDNFRLRGGVVRSQFGLGADTWLFDRRLELSVDAYDTRHAKVDVLGRLVLPGDLYLYGGVRDAADRRHSHPVVGAGKRF